MGDLECSSYCRSNEIKKPVIITHALESRKRCVCLANGMPSQKKYAAVPWQVERASAHIDILVALCQASDMFL